MFAIEKVGVRPYYCIKSVCGNGTTPVDYKRYETLDAAMQAAKSLGVRISAVGDYYVIVHIAMEIEEATK